MRKVLLLGSGALKIGEAGEFDYSGSQAIKAFKEEGVEVVLVNPNIATVQTDVGFADRIYFLPVEPHFVEEVIKKERPDGIVCSFGGQTALNCAVALEEAGVFRRYGVEVLGTPIRTIKDTEDRARFADRLRQWGVPTPPGETVRDVESGVSVAERIGYPVMVRMAFALGGRGSGVARDERSLRKLLMEALRAAPQALIEPYLAKWREVEYEVMRDVYDNCICICNMENFDPMGIHTGESIVVAPSQTLTNDEYHALREAAIKVVRGLGVVGECNVQFALSHDGSRFYVIEVNARLSRSSALASKATGYPIAYIAAHLALGRSLLELKNRITGVTCALFEPALDYVVVKVPRWDLNKFTHVDERIGTEMKSVGEVMAIGRLFEEALQKALRMSEISRYGLESNRMFEDLDAALSEPTPQRVFAVAAALRHGYSVQKIFELTGISPHFIERIKRIVDTELRLAEEPLTRGLLLCAKRLGFSDAHVAAATGRTEEDVRALRQKWRIRPVVKRIDTLAAEYPAKTNYLYLTYNAAEDDIPPARRQKKRSILVLGSGPYRIGSSIEFDWCCVQCARRLRQLKYRAIMLNCNPETVSTDYDECDTLYFDELTLERVLDIWEHEKPYGVVVSMGGQTPNSLALPLAQRGVRILGTSPHSIDRAEDRNKFSSLLDELGVEQPEWVSAESVDAALRFAARVGYPLLVRPSYVLSGAAMRVVYNERQLLAALTQAADCSPQHPVVVSKFIENAKEIEFDGIAAEGEVKLYAITEHVEDAGVHSGDATLLLPAQRIWVETQRRIKRIAQRVARQLHICGPFNIQFLAKENRIKIIELNLRASRTFPFVSKVYARNFAAVATDALLGRPLERTRKLEVEHVAVKVPQFSFERLKGADPIVGVEMRSTGEVACIGETPEEAFLKALCATGFPVKIRGIFLDVVNEREKFRFIEPVETLIRTKRLKIYAPEPFWAFMRYHGCRVERLDYADLSDAILRGDIDVMIQISRNASEEALEWGYGWRRMAVDLNVPVLTNTKSARLLLSSLSQDTVVKGIHDWSYYCG